MPHQLNSSSRLLYDNCLVQCPDGKPIFRCDLRKMDWYLKRDLAEMVGLEPPTIRLTFEPQGNGHLGDPFFLQARKNKCVVCGTTEQLTRHHVVPHCYRRWFPESLKRFGSYDVFALCTQHHHEYEVVVKRYRHQIANIYDAPVQGERHRACPEANRGHRAVNAVYALAKFSHKMPQHRIHELQQTIEEYFGTSNVTDEMCQHALKDHNKWVGRTHGQMAVDSLGGCLENLNKFMIRWRKHFVETMNPRHLPDHWDAERLFYPDGKTSG